MPQNTQITEQKRSRRHICAAARKTGSGQSRNSSGVSFIQASTQPLFYKPMLPTPSRLPELPCTLDLPTEGSNLLAKIRKGTPVREVTSRVGNVINFFQSRKMGREVWCESHTVEFPFAFMHEHDPETLEFYLQPWTFDVRLFADEIEPGSKAMRFQYTPDSFILCPRSARIEEWKSETELRRLSLKQPLRYRKTEFGWSSPALEVYYAKFGFEYRIRSDAEIPQIYLENLTFLEDYFDPSCEPVRVDLLNAMHDALTQDPVLTIRDLQEKVAGGAIDHVFKAIADGHLVADIYGELLREPYRCCVYRDSSVLAATRAKSLYDVELPTHAECQSIRVDAIVRLDGVEYKIVHEGAGFVILSGPRTFPMPIEQLKRLIDGKDATILNPEAESGGARVRSLTDASEPQLREALHRLAQLRGECPVEVTERSMRRWVKELPLNGDGPETVAALVSNKNRRGNRSRKLPADVIACMNSVIKKDYLSEKAINGTELYKLIKAECEKRGLVPPGYDAVRFQVNEMETGEGTKARFGKRVAYQAKPFTWRLDYRSPVHGVRALEVVHIDHTELDIVLICPRTAKVLGRVWLTLAIDASTRRVVGFYISFSSPSYVSVMMVLRDMVRRCGHLPAVIVVDNGKEFHSKSFRLFAKIYSIKVKYRPAAQARFGSVMERVFGTANTTFVHNLEGNTKILTRVRQVTKSVNPFNIAKWNFEALYVALETWAFDVYETSFHEGIGMTPREALTHSIANHGQREHKIVLYDRNFMILTLPDAECGGARTVQKQRGLKVGNKIFWCDEFLDAKSWGKKVAVKIDPWDTDVVYAFVNNEWRRCISRDYHQSRILTVFQRKAMQEEVARRTKINRKDAKGQSLKEWVAIRDVNEMTSEAMLRANAERDVYSRQGLAAVELRTRLDSHRNALQNEIGQSSEKLVEVIENDKKSINIESEINDECDIF